MRLSGLYAIIVHIITTGVHKLDRLGICPVQDLLVRQIGARIVGFMVKAPHFAQR